MIHRKWVSFSKPSCSTSTFFFGFRKKKTISFLLVSLTLCIRPKSLLYDQCWKYYLHVLFWWRYGVTWLTSMASTPIQFTLPRSRHSLQKFFSDVCRKKIDDTPERLPPFHLVVFADGPFDIARNVGDPSASNKDNRCSHPYSVPPIPFSISSHATVSRGSIWPRSYSPFLLFFS